MEDIQVILCTTPDMESARKIARHVVENNFAACCNLMPSVESIYRWHDKIEQEQEVLLFIKSTSNRFSQIEQVIIDLHPYELPEIIALPIDEGYAPYLDWIMKSTKGIVNNGT